MATQDHGPRAPRRPAVKTIGAVRFEDPFANLQDASEESLAWQWAQDALAEQDARSWPGFARVRARIGEVAKSAGSMMEGPPRRLGGRWFWTGSTAKSPAMTVLVSDTVDGPRRAVVEMTDLLPAEQAPTGMVIWYEPSPDGELVALAVISGGAMVGTWYIVECATGRVLATRPCVAYTGARPGWLPDASGFYLGERDGQNRHTLVFVPIKPGTPDRPTVTFEFTDIPANVSGLTPEVSPDGSRVILLAGPHERIAYVIGEPATGTWRRFLPSGHEGECQGAWLGNDTWVARVHSDDVPRGRVVAIPAATSTDAATWREILPQSESVLRAVRILGDRVVVGEVHHCSARFRTMALDGSDRRTVPLEGPGSSMITYIQRRFDTTEVLVIDYQTFTRSSGTWLYDPATDRLTLVRAPGAELKGITVGQRFAKSLDGTQVPYFVVHRADVALDRPRPTLVTGYGGFNVALMPSFLNHIAPFIEAGGVYVHANLRGGAEYGKHWHEAGRLACKWNVFLDLFAVAEQLIADGLTTSDLLGMTGASNGGLLAGVAIAHRPDLWRVVVPVVPIFDQMEPIVGGPELEPVRAIFYEDYGDPKHPAMSRVLYSYSPYHSIRDGVAYPAVFSVFGEKDLGCMPFQGRKFTARLHEASTSGRSIRLRVWRATGHGAMGETGELQAAEWLSFVMRELGMTPA